MKKLSFFIIASLLLVTSCKKDDAATDPSAATSDDAAQIVGETLASNGGGATAAMTGSLAASGSASVISGLRSASTSPTSGTHLKDTTITVTTPAGALATVNFTSTLTLTKATNDSSLTATHTYNGTVDAPLYTAAHSGTGTYTFTNLGTLVGTTFHPDSIWTMNGGYTRTGTHTIKLSNKTMHHTTNATFTNVLMNRLTRTIKSGTGSFTITGYAGTDPTKKTFSYAGTLTFDNNTSATVIIGGKSYLIRLLDGNVTPK